MFNLKLSKIPLLNLRQEFATHYQLLADKEFRSQFSGNQVPIDSPYFSWNGMQNDFLTLILQRAILGIESFLPGAVFFEAGMRDLLQGENLKKIKNPFLFGHKKLVYNYYHLLPSLLDESLSLKVSDHQLWEDNFQFYNQVRNPLFHGKQVESRDPFPVYRAYKHIAKIYDWVDTWHSFDQVVGGFENITKITSQKRS